MRKLLLAALVSTAIPCFASDIQEFEIVIKDHHFDPREIWVPANEQIRLIVKNEDSTPEEFESGDFDVEKIIPGNSTASILVVPLKPGKHEFYGEFHQNTANGNLLAE